jgi:hypothetical protein
MAFSVAEVCFTFEAGFVTVAGGFLGASVKRTWPLESTASQNVMLGQETPTRLRPESIPTGDPMWDPSMLTSCPSLSTATHVVVPSAQETASSCEPLSAAVELQVPTPPAGFVEVNTFPELSTAAQNDILGHETAVSVAPDSPLGAEGELQPVDGLVDVSIRPDSPTATQTPLLAAVPGAHANPRIGNRWLPTLDQLTLAFVGVEVHSISSLFSWVWTQNEPDPQARALKFPSLAGLNSQLTLAPLTDATFTHPPPAVMQLDTLKQTTLRPASLGIVESE